MKFKNYTKIFIFISLLSIAANHATLEGEKARLNQLYHQECDQHQRHELRNKLIVVRHPMLDHLHGVNKRPTLSAFANYKEVVKATTNEIDKLRLYVEVKKKRLDKYNNLFSTKYTLSQIWDLRYSEHIIDPEISKIHNQIIYILDSL